MSGLVVIYVQNFQAARLRSSQGIKLVEKDRGAKMMTTYTPEFLNLPKGIWAQGGGDRNAGDGVVIGFVDSGINPLHPSFAYDPMHPFTSNLSHFKSACQTGPLFPLSSCNGKIVAARYFSAGAQATVTLNASKDFLSPFDADGHGRYILINSYQYQPDISNLFPSRLTLIQMCLAMAK